MMKADRWRKTSQTIRLFRTKSWESAGNSPRRVWSCMHLRFLCLTISGFQSSRRPDGVLWRTHTRRSPHHARARLWEPVPGEEVLLHHSLMTWRRSCTGAGMALPGFSVFTTPEATGHRRWVEFCQVDTLLLVSSVLVAEGFGGVSYQTGNPVSVSCLVN